MNNKNERVMIGVHKDLAKGLDEIGFNVKIKTRPSVIAFLVDKYRSDLE